jgi:hypothetical protein
MKNIFLVAFGFFLFTFLKNVSAATEFLPSPHHTTGQVGSRMTGSDKEYEDKVFSIIGGEFYFNESDDYLNHLNKETLVKSIGAGFLAEFYRLLGDFYSSKHVFDKAGESYYRALHMLDKPDQNLRKFLSVIGVTQHSTANDIKTALEGRADRKERK